jgi:hypothetical protein
VWVRGLEREGGRVGGRERGREGRRERQRDTDLSVRRYNQHVFVCVSDCISLSLSLSLAVSVSVFAQASDVMEKIDMPDNSLVIPP